MSSVIREFTTDQDFPARSICSVGVFYSSGVLANTLDKYPASRGFSLVFSQRCTAILFAVLAARVLFWSFLCRGKDLCRQPFGIPVEHVN